MTSGDIITWVLAAIIAVAFLIGLKHVYRNFVSGESDCCGNAGCANCPEGSKCAVDKLQDEKIIRDAENKLKAEHKTEALKKLEEAEKTHKA